MPAAAHAWLSGDEDAPLGVSSQALRSLAPSPGAAQAAIAALLPAVEHELQWRCKLCAAAAGYDGNDPRGLGDYVTQLSAAVEDARAARADGWARAAVAAQQATRLLAAAGGSAEGVLRRHTLGGVRESDTARCEALRAHAARLAAKLADAVVQLRSVTYTTDTLPALREVERQVSAALAERRSEAKLRSAVLAQCRAVGPELRTLAVAHAALQAQLADAEYELSELGRYQELAAVLAQRGGAGA